MTDFGDFELDDAYDPNEPADPEQVAIKLQTLRYDRSLESRRWNQLTVNEQTVRIGVVIALLAWLRRSGARP
jgi:hypothetical protein